MKCNFPIIYIKQNPNNYILIKAQNNTKEFKNFELEKSLIQCFISIVEPTCDVIIK